MGPNKEGGGRQNNLPVAWPTRAFHETDEKSISISSCLGRSAVGLLSLTICHVAARLRQPSL